MVVQALKRVSRGQMPSPGGCSHASTFISEMLSANALPASAVGQVGPRLITSAREAMLWLPIRLCNPSAAACKYSKCSGDSVVPSWDALQCASFSSASRTVNFKTADKIYHKFLEHFSRNYVQFSLPLAIQALLICRSLTVHETPNAVSKFYRQLRL